MRAKHIYILVALLWAVSPLLAADFYVAPDGDDADPGTLTDPLATLAGARDAVRQLRIDQPDKGDVVVLLRGGTYTLSETVIFEPQDSAPAGSRTIYAAYPGETPVLTSGVPVTSWRPTAQDPDYLPAAAAGQLWEARIPPAIDGLFKTMFDGSTELPRARSAGFKPILGPNDPNIHQFALTELHYPEGTVIRDWPNMSDIEILIRPRVLWMMNILTLAAVDEANRIAHTTISATYPMTKERFYRFDDDGSVWVENAIDCLDAPGEWIVDTSADRIYYWPASGTPSNDIVIPALKEFVKVQGVEDFDNPNPVRGLVFDGLTFTCGERHTWTEDEATIQHGWESYNTNNAMLRFWWVEDCLVRNCRFVDSAATGVRFDFYAMHNRVYNNEFARLGGSGIVLCGYGPGIRNHNRFNRIIKNEIHDCGRHYWHANGITVFQSGDNVISHNRIYDTPYTGMCVTGVGEQFFTLWGLDRREMRTTIRWDEVSIDPNDYTGINGDMPSFSQIERYLYARNNLLQYNDISNVMLVLGDGNGIYIRFCPRGNIIRRNFLHDIVGAHAHGAIRCDDGQAKVDINENIIYRCVRTGIVFKERNYVNNNIIAHLYEENDPENIHDVPLLGYMDVHAEIVGSEINNNIFYHAGPAAVDYIYDRGDDSVGQCESDNNVFYHVQNPAHAAAYLAAMTGQENSIAADPLFVNIAQDNLNLQSGSPAYGLGFTAINFDAMGLYWPWDVNYNGVLGIDDLTYLTQRWLSEDCFVDMEQSITNDNCFIDMLKLAQWLNHYQETTETWQ